MEIRLLGTGAAEGYPALACGCDNCRVARERGGTNLRKRSHALVDGRVLIDLGPDLLWATQQFGIELHRIAHVLLTHGHDDHLYLANLEYRGTGFAPGEIAEWEMRGSAASLGIIQREFPDESEIRVRMRAVRAFETFELGPYTVTALRARHAVDLEPLFYAIRHGDAAILYATDSGPWLDETWAHLEELGRMGVRFGVAIVEATSGTHVRPPEQGPGGHMTFADMTAHMRGLRERGLLRADAKLVATHFSHNAVPPHDETAALLAPEGIIPGYDGFAVEV